MLALHDHIVDLSKVTHLYHWVGDPNSTYSKQPYIKIYLDGGEYVQVVDETDMRTAQEAWINYLGGGQLLPLR